LADLDLKVSASKRLPKLNYTLELNAVSDITFSGLNRLIARDFKAETLGDISASGLTLMLTDYDDGPSPAVNINSQSSLAFAGTTQISGGYILLSGLSGIKFTDQASIFATKQDNAPVNEPLYYTLSLLSSGTISCMSCILASEGNVTIQAGKSFVGDSLVISADNNVQYEKKTGPVSPDYPTVNVWAYGGVEFD
jgi:hypothetical protein